MYSGFFISIVFLVSESNFVFFCFFFQFQWLFYCLFQTCLFILSLIQFWSEPNLTGPVLEPPGLELSGLGPGTWSVGSLFQLVCPISFFQSWQHLPADQIPNYCMFATETALEFHIPVVMNYKITCRYERYLSYETRQLLKYWYHWGFSDYFCLPFSTSTVSVTTPGTVHFGLGW